MEKAAIRMELVQDPDLRTSIGNAIQDNRKAIYTEALKQMQKQKMERVAAMGSPTRLALHKVSFEAMSAAVGHFDGRMKINNQLADIVTPKLKQAEEERHKQSKEYQEEQAFLKLMQSHQKTMAKRRKDKEQKEANEVKKGKEEEEALKADQESVKEQQSKGADGGSNIVQAVKEPLVMAASQSESPSNKIQESSKKEASKLDISPVNKERSNLFKVQQTPQDKKTYPPLPLSSTLKPNQQSKPGNQPSPQQQKTENLFTAALKAEQKAGGIFGNPNSGPTSGPKLFQSDKQATSTQKPAASLFGSGPSSSLYDGTKTAGNPTSIFGTNVNQSPLNFFGGPGNTNTAPATNLFKAQPKTGQSEVDGNSLFAGLFTQPNKTSQNPFLAVKKDESNFNKSSSGNQRITPGTFAIGQDNKKPAQSIDDDNVLASRDYSLSGNAK